MGIVIEQESADARLSRRQLLMGALRLGEYLVGGYVLGNYVGPMFAPSADSDSADLSLKPVPSAETLIPPIPDRLEQIKFLHSDIILELDDELIPRKYHYYSDGLLAAELPVEAQPEFPVREYELPYYKIIKAKGEALEKRESKIAFVISSGEGQPQDTYPSIPQEEFIKESEHRVLRTVPDDVVFDDQLAGRGIKIIQSVNRQLYIREGAFSAGGPLEGHGSPSDRLTIALVDGPIIAGNMLDPRYDLVRDTLDDPINVVSQFRAKKLESLNQTLQGKRRDLALALESRDQAKQKAALDSKLQTKIDYYLYKNIYSPKDIAYNLREFSGLYVPNAKLADGTRSSVVFATVSDGTWADGFSVIYYDEKGALDAIDVWRDHTLIVTGLDTFQSCPNPNNYKLNEQASKSVPGSYPYGAQSAGFVLRHEISHDLLISQRYPSDHSEYDTDMEAYSQIKSAWDRWVSSDYTDDSGYFYAIQDRSVSRGIYLT